MLLVSYTLVHDTVEKLQDIIEDFATTDATRNFLKRQYDRCLQEDHEGDAQGGDETQGIDTHGVKHGLMKLRNACRFGMVVFIIAANATR